MRRNVIVMKHCRNCALRYDLVKVQYTPGGCECSGEEGFICMAMAGEGQATWMVGMNENCPQCDMFVRADVVN